MPASEKPENELFFVHKGRGEDEISAPDNLTKCVIRQKPLRSELNLQPNPAIKGFPVRKRKTPRKTKGVIHDLLPTQIDSSSDEGDFAKSISYRSISCSREEKLISRKKECPDKPMTRVATMDLWNEGKRR